MASNDKVIKLQGKIKKHTGSTQLRQVAFKRDGVEVERVCYEITHYSSIKNATALSKLHSSKYCLENGYDSCIFLF